MNLPKKSWRNCRSCGDRFPTEETSKTAKVETELTPRETGKTAEDVETKLPQRDRRNCREESTKTPQCKTARSEQNMIKKREKLKRGLRKTLGRVLTCVTHQRHVIIHVNAQISMYGIRGTL
ncbi:hypothetical protein PIB30_023346 [Stylosanthes scabra]|uniref:Uncharacterized protein n=1 Tax=Stylosanthes scabra TaxID=79078 RepID=A0ABU6T947_9FABA|nr:hypothetical protein [Stylosanthes scabra]